MTDKSDQFDLQDFSQVKELLKELSSQDFLSFGVHEVAYIKAVDVDGEEAFAVHAADGTPLSVMDTFDSAEIAAKQNDLETVSVH